jgi:hypothetical protein
MDSMTAFNLNINKPYDQGKAPHTSKKSLRPINLGSPFTILICTNTTNQEISLQTNEKRIFGNIRFSSQPVQYTRVAEFSQLTVPHNDLHHGQF